jgi:hypothetical protein
MVINDDTCFLFHTPTCRVTVQLTTVPSGDDETFRLPPIRLAR